MHSDVLSLGFQQYFSVMIPRRIHKVAFIWVHAVEELCIQSCQIIPDGDAAALKLLPVFQDGLSEYWVSQPEVDGHWFVVCYMSWLWQWVGNSRVVSPARFAGKPSDQSPLV